MPADPPTSAADDDEGPPRLLVRTPEGAEASSYPLHEFHLSLGGREWAFLHAGMILTRDDESRYLREMRETQKKIPYGLSLWPAAIALAYEIAERGAAGEMARETILELGAGTGLPGIVAAALGEAARVVQTDRDETALSLCRRNAARNSAAGIEQRLADWEEWEEEAPRPPIMGEAEREAEGAHPSSSSPIPRPSSLTYDWIIGSDILYAEPMHPHLLRIFQTVLAPGGRILLSDPFRAASLRFLESLQEEQGWRVSVTKWNLGDDKDPRAVGVFELSR